jgi:hypothetical protein
VVSTFALRNWIGRDLLGSFVVPASEQGSFSDWRK